MLIEKFKEIVASHPRKIAVKSKDTAFTYKELDRYANRIARALKHRVAPCASQDLVVGLLFQHGCHMIAALLGALKAGCIYVPLDNSYPESRLEYMLEHSGAVHILTNSANLPLAERLTGGNTGVLDVEQLEGDITHDTEDNAPLEQRNSNGGKTAYILYTSGSTGKPKGVYQTHENVWYFIRHWIRRFAITHRDNITLLTAFSHDGAVPDIYASLLSGASLFPFNIKNIQHQGELAGYLTREKITIWHSVPTLFRYFAGSLEENGNGDAIDFSHLRFIQLGGEALRSRDALLLKRYFPNSIMANVYGQTESTVNSIAMISPDDTMKTIVIGDPLEDTEIFLVDEDGQLVEDFGTGEIVVACDHTAPGYWQDPETTAQRFTRDPEAGRLYWTGDLGGLLDDGRIEIIGRKDHQVKIRGFRVETGEIESVLLQHPDTREAVVTAGEDDTGDTHLCAYITGTGEDTGLRAYLMDRLPDYMVPSYFVHLEAMPLTPNGKIDRKALPSPRTLDKQAEYAPPQTPVEEQLVKIWAEVLNLPPDTIGIHHNFFELGGHSLKAVTLSLKIHRQLNVRMELPELFASATIRQMAQFIETAPRDYYSGLEKAPQQDYYELSPAQKRMLVLSGQEGVGTTYNMYKLLILEEKGRVREDFADRIEGIFSALIRRHESLRTSFHIVDGLALQKITDTVDFTLERRDYTREAAATGMEALIKAFVRPFDLSQAPLLRVGLYTLAEGKHVLAYDMHHIISDGISIGILAQDFIRLYSGYPLPPLRIQYKDFAHWQLSLFQSDVMQRQRTYWGGVFREQAPMLAMPLDFDRPGTMTFKGANIDREIKGTPAGALYRLAEQEQATPNIVLLAIYTLLISQYSGQEDIVTGSLAAGRQHPDLEQVMGMFANFLPIRIALPPGRTFGDYLNRVKTTALEAYQNQDCPFEEIVKLADLPRHDRANAMNPLFTTMFLFHSEADRVFEGHIEDLVIGDYPFKDATSTLDFKLDVYPMAAAGNPMQLLARLEYNTGLFKQETMERFLARFEELLAAVTGDGALEKPLADFGLLDSEEERQLVEKREKFEILEEEDQPAPLRLAVSATFTSEPIADYITYWGAQYGMDVDVQFAPYNQVFQQLLDLGSLLSGNTGSEGEHCGNLILVRFEDWLRDEPGDTGDEARIEKLEANFKELTHIVSGQSGTVPLFAAVFPQSPYTEFSETLSNHIREMYRRWAETVNSLNRRDIWLIDFTPLQSLYQVEEVFNPETDRQGHLPFSSEYYAAMGTFITRQVYAYFYQHYKVIALDCDNTLWQGICGEDGAEGVRIEGPWLEFQHFLVDKYRQGMLLTLCSKNNEADVWDVFEKNPHMPLKREHFVDWRINWAPKSGNLAELAADLNLGIDSFIFVDDSPMECSEVMAHQEEVLSIKLPEDPGEIPMFIKHIWAFDRVKVTVDDKTRSTMYLTERKRKEIKKKMPSLDEFIRSLELEIRMTPLLPGQLPRASQLTQRTNQFNLSTIRRSEGEIGGLMESPGIRCWIIGVSDRFGDYGLTGLAITREDPAGQSLFIDTLLLSCRVLGRNVEYALLAGLGRLCRKQGFTRLTADFYPTAKNKPLLQFLQGSGWREENATGDGAAWRFSLALDSIPPVPETVDFQMEL